VKLKDIIGGISRSESVKDIYISLFSILLALIIGALLIFLIGSSPLQAFTVMLDGAFGSISNIANTLSKTIPLIFTGLAVAVAFRCGLFNIGAEGQLYLGAFFSVLTALKFSFLPAFLLLPVAILGGIISGMIWGGIPGFFKAQFGTHEVVVTVMMNYIGINITSYLVNYPFKAEGWVAQTDIIPNAANLPKLIPKTQLSDGLIVAIIAALAVYFLLWKTDFGYEIRAVGENPTTAESGGINIKKNISLAMAISGGLAALAGVTQSLGVYERFIDGFSPGYGFTGIAVAVLGRNHPLGVILTALLFGALETGALKMDRVTEISNDLVIVIQGLVILFVAAPEIIRSILKRRESQ